MKTISPIVTVTLFILGTFAAASLMFTAAHGLLTLEFNQMIGNKWASATIIALSASLLALSLFQKHRYSTSIVLAIMALFPLAGAMTFPILVGSTLTELSGTNAQYVLITSAFVWCSAILSISALVLGILQAVVEIVWRLLQFK